jgi:hypothetical protein
LSIHWDLFGGFAHGKGHGIIFRINGGAIKSMSVAKELYQLQLLDSEREQRLGRLGEIAGALGQEGDVLRAREAVAETEGRLEALRTQLRGLEVDIARLEAKLKENQDRLYGGRVRNPKELSSLQEEAAALRRRRSELEENQLELMIDIEAEEAELSERQARLRQIDTAWREEQAGLLSERNRLEQRLAELDGQIQNKRARLKAADLALYDDLRRSLGGRAVVLLKRGICQSCGVDLPTGLAQAVERGEGLDFCPTCNRLLYGG